jgi:hypothetical protein
MQDSSYRNAQARPCDDSSIVVHALMRHTLRNRTMWFMPKTECEPVPTVVDKFPEPMGKDVERQFKGKDDGEEKVKYV